MNSTEIGVLVKQKYPQYQGLSDEEVGNLTLQKYPQYGGMQSTPSANPTPVNQPTSQPSSLDKVLQWSNNFKENHGMIKTQRDIARFIGLGSLENIPGALYEGQRAARLNLLNDPSGYIKEGTGETVQNPFINEDKLQRLSANNPGDAAKQIAGEGVEGIAAAATMGMSSQLKLAKEVPAATRFLNTLGYGVKARVIPGTIIAGGRELAKEDSTPESVIKAAEDGALFSALFFGGEKLMGGIKEHLGKQAPKFMRKLFKVNSDDLIEFEDRTGTDFHKAILSKDLNNIQGKNGEQIVKYYTNQLDDAEGAVDRLIARKYTSKTVSKQEILENIDEIYTSVEDDLLPEPSKFKLEQLKSRINEAPDDIPLAQVQKWKRQAQDLAKEAYNPDGSASMTSKNIATVADRFKKILERDAPEVMDLNKNVQFYRLAKDSITKQVNNLAKRDGGGWISQGIQGGSIAASVLTGNPLFAALGIGGPLATQAGRSPQGRTIAASASTKIRDMPGVPEALKRLLLIGGAGATAE